MIGRLAEKPRELAGFVRAATVVLFGIVSVVAPGAANAQSTSLDMAGEMEDVCVAAPGATVSAQNFNVRRVTASGEQSDFEGRFSGFVAVLGVGITLGGNIVFELDYYCNTQFSVDVQSLHGGLYSSNALTNLPVLRKRVPYAFSIPGLIDQPVDSRDLQTSGQVEAINQVPQARASQMQLEWESIQAVLAGNYGDVLNISLVVQ